MLFHDINNKEDPIIIINDMINSPQFNFSDKENFQLRGIYSNWLSSANYFSMQQDFVLGIGSGLGIILAIILILQGISSRTK